MESPFTLFTLNVSVQFGAEGNNEHTFCAASKTGRAFQLGRMLKEDFLGSELGKGCSCTPGLCPGCLLELAFQKLPPKADSHLAKQDHGAGVL